MISHLLHPLRMSSKNTLCLSWMLCACAMLSTPAALAQEITTSVAKPPDDMFVDVHIPEYQIYLGETIPIEYDVYVASNRGQLFYNAQEPDFSGWYTLEGTAPQASHVYISGKSYLKEPFAVFLITPTKIGQIPLPPLNVELPYSPNSWITHDPHIVEVIPPPTPAPKDFAPANIGVFSIHASLLRENIRVGHAAIIQITLEANAPIAGVQLAPYDLGPYDDMFKIYPFTKDALKENIVNNTIHASRQFRLRLVPLQPGSYTLPPVKIVTFNPKIHQYQTIQSQPLQLQVEPSNTPADINIQTVNTKLFQNDDIIPIIPKRNFITYPSWLLLVLFSIPPLALALFILLYELKKRKYAQHRLLSMMNTFEQLSKNAQNTDDAFIQLQSIRQILYSCFELQIGVSESLLQKQLSSLFSKQECDILFPLSQKLRIQAASSHKPISKNELNSILNILKKHVTNSHQGSK